MNFKAIEKYSLIIKILNKFLFRQIHTKKLKKFRMKNLIELKMQFKSICISAHNLKNFYRMRIFNSKFYSN